MGPSCLRVFVGLIVSAVALCRGDDANRDAPQPLTAELRERCLSVLRTGLKSDEFWPAMHAAEALTLAGAGGEVIASLQDCLPIEKDAQHRCGLARELARAGERKHVEVLLQVLGDEASSGRVHAAESLYKVGETGDGSLLKAAMTQSVNVPLQIMAAGALAKAGNADAVVLLRAKLSSKDQTARSLSAWILGRLGDAADVEPMLAALATESDEMGQAFLAVSLACLGNEAGRTNLGRHLESKNVTARTMAAEFVGHSRSIEFRSRLIEMLDDPVLDVRVRAAQSLVALSMPKGGK